MEFTSGSRKFRCAPVGSSVGTNVRMGDGAIDVGSVVGVRLGKDDGLGLVGRDVGAGVGTGVDGTGVGNDDGVDDGGMVSRIQKSPALVPKLEPKYTST